MEKPMEIEKCDKADVDTDIEDLKTRPLNTPE